MRPLVATSTAAFRVAQEEAGLAPGLVIGHSLGGHNTMFTAAFISGFGTCLDARAVAGTPKRCITGCAL